MSDINPLDSSPGREQAQPLMTSYGLKSDTPVTSNEPGSWKKTLFPELRHPKNFRLRFIPPTVRDAKAIGVCSKSAIEGELVILDMTLVGFFLGRRPSFSFVKSALLKQWKLQGNVEIIQMLQGGYAFRFSDIGDRDNILEGDSYFVGGQPMFLRAWERNLHTGGVLGLRKIPLWISLPGLPLHLWGEEALSSVCSVLGIPLYADKNTALKSRLAFARVCVEFTADTPLLETITIEDDLGLTYEQRVTYEWRPPHCLSCGVFGHEECAILVEDKEKEALIREELNTDSVRKGEEELLLQKSGFLPASLGRNLQESMKEVEEETGWEQVRARKKRPGLAGAPFSGQARPDSQRSNSGNLLVSNTHWRALKQAAHQVSPSVVLPNMGLNSNSYPCPQSGPGLLTPLEKGAWQKDNPSSPNEDCPHGVLPNIGSNLNSNTCPHSEPCPLTQPEKDIIQNGKTTPPWQPLDGPNSREPLVCEPDNPAKPSEYPKSGPTDFSAPKALPNSLESLNKAPSSAETSAGHTPYHNRLATLARDLRRRQSGMAGLKTNDDVGPKSSGESQGDKHPSLSFSLPDMLNKESLIRPGIGQIANQGVNGISGNNTSRIEDRLGNLREENTMKNKVMQKEGDSHSRKTQNINFPEVHGGRKIFKDVARKGAHASTIGRDNGEVGQHSELGHGLAETQ